MRVYYFVFMLDSGGRTQFSNGHCMEIYFTLTVYSHSLLAEYSRSSHDVKPNAIQSWMLLSELAYI